MENEIKQQYMELTGLTEGVVDAMTSGELTDEQKSRIRFCMPSGVAKLAAGSKDVLDTILGGDANTDTDEPIDPEDDGTTVTPQPGDDETTVTPQPGDDENTVPTDPEDGGSDDPTEPGDDNTDEPTGPSGEAGGIITEPDTEE